MMASLLLKERDYKYMAEKYSELTQPEIEDAKKLIALLGVKSGEKVLDIGCGTGEITAFIADQVGEEGHVVGVDPDEERIKIAIQKHSGRKNVSFMAGDSSSHFPHCNEEYYDTHFSNFMFHWLSPQEKADFLETASKCLKPGGRIAMYNITDKNPDILEEIPELLPDDEIENNRSPYHFVEKSVTESMLKELGFVILSSEYHRYNNTYPNLDCFLTSLCSACYIDESKILPHKKKAFAKKFVHEDGTVYLEIIGQQIIAKKLNAIN